MRSIKHARIMNYYSIISRELHFPFYGSFELTPRCNMNCKMCYIRMSPEEMKSVGKELSADEWIRVAQEAVDMGMMNVLLTGGEAIMHPEFKKIYLAIKKMGTFVSINTNGTMLNDDWINFFEENMPAQINITLYGGSNETYERLCCNPKGYTQVKNAIEKLLKHHIPVSLNCVITKQNSCDTDEIIKFAREHDIQVSSTAYCFPPVRKEGIVNPELNRFEAKDAAFARIKLNWATMNDKKQFYNRACRLLDNPDYKDNLDNSCVDEVGDKVLCAAGRSNFWITWDGRMLPCGMIPDFSIPIKGVPFEQVWNQIVEYTASIRLSSECKNCSKKDICSPCAAKLKSETGSFDKKSTYLCEFTDEYIKLLAKSKQYLEKNNK